MKFQKLVCLLSLLALLSPLANAQLPLETAEVYDFGGLKKNAVVFLRETMADVNNLRTLENRISFSAELAGLMWFHDEKEARSLYVTAFGNFKELLMQYDQQANALGEPAEGEEMPYGRGMFTDVSDRTVINKRFQTAMHVRQQIAMSLAEHDAELAFTFYSDSAGAVSNPEFRRKMEERDEYFEAQLLTQVAKSDAAKAAQLAAKSVSAGLNYQHLDLLQKIYDKDPEKGAEFAASMLSKIKSDKLEADKFYIAGSFLSLAGASYEGSKTEGGKKAMLSPSDLRDLADALAQGIMANDTEYGNGLQYIGDIEKYSPSRARQVRAKFKDLAGPGGTYGMNTNVSYRYSNSANNASNRVRANMNTNAGAEDRARSEKEFSENIEKLAKKELPKSEREKIVAHARRILLQTPGKDKKIAGLSALAAQVSRVGDKELAADIMKEANALVNPQPKNYQDFLLTWMLASGYAEAEPEKAFPLLEDTILRVNDTLSAFIKVGEFIDVAGEMIDDGEVQVGAFSGNMIRGLTSELGMADNTLRLLAKADFNKTKNLTSRFDRSEVRILAKMMILRAVLGEEKQKKDKSAAVSVDK